MFHKNSKAISPLKYRLGINELWFFGSFSNKSIINNTHFFNFFFISLFLECIINLLYKKSHKLFRFQVQNKKRKLLFLYKKLSILAPVTFKKIILKLLIRKRLKKRRILFLKKTNKYRSKQFFFKKKYNSLYNGVCGQPTIILNNLKQYIIYLPIAIMQKSGFSAIKRTFYLKKTNSLVFIKKAKISFLKLFFLKLFIESFLFSYLQIIINLNFIDNYFLNKLSKYFNKNVKYMIKKFCKKRYIKKDLVFKKLLYTTNAAYFFNDPKMLAIQLAERLTKIKLHKIATKQFHKALYAAMPINAALSGIRILICGKIGAKTRTKTMTIKYGLPIKVQSLANNINYAYVESQSYTGVFGIHVWFLFD
jgi:hypothetical protein